MERTGKIRIEVKKEEIPYEPPADFFERETEGGEQLSMLMESRRRDLTYGTKAVAVTKPGLQFTGKGQVLEIGKGDDFELRALSDAGRNVLDIVAEGIQGIEGVSLDRDGPYGRRRRDSLEDRVTGTIKRQDSVLPEHLRIRQPGLGGVLRHILSMFSIDDPDAGLYGAFAYDYVRQGENIGNRFTGGGPDVNLVLPFELVVFDELRKTAVKKTYSFSTDEAAPVRSRLSFGKHQQVSTDMTNEQYMASVDKIIREISAGEMIQAVLSKTIKTGLIQHPFESYQTLARINPSPYCFFLNLGEDEALFGASPEMHVRIEGGKAELRPLAGTRRRTGNAVDDHYVKQGLLGDPKEQQEHVMLVDLARNDLARACTGVHVERFMDIVEFPNLYHIGSSITGLLREGVDALDAILTTLPQGTLSGAPKVRAMQEIEGLENSRRGYYGGCVGMIGFNGDCNTAITIRSIHSKSGYGFVRAGAGIVIDSKPESELAEVNLKNENQLRALGGKAK